MKPGDVSASLDALEPALPAAAKNVLRHGYGPDGMPWGTRLDQAEDFAVQVADRLAQLILEVGLRDFLRNGVKRVAGVDKRGVSPCNDAEASPTPSPQALTPCAS